jgi:flagellar FliJ protein
MTTRTFGLAGLLRLRTIEQDQAGVVLATANSRSRALHARTSAARRELGDAPVEVSSTQALRMAAISRASSRSMLSDLIALEAIQNEETAAAQADYLAARSRTVGLEKLEAKHTAGVMAKDLAVEQDALDEISSSTRFRAKEAASA